MNGFVRWLKILPSQFLWLAVLTPILAVSGWSAYFIGRYLGMPAAIAASVSACLDGTALLAADYSVKYAQAAMPSSGPKFVVWLFAGTSAFIQTRHALIGNELPGSWILWASLPIAAATVFELHLRWARRKAKAKAGAVYPKPLPSFGLITWVYYPVSTHFRLRQVVGVRRDALLVAAVPAKSEPVRVDPARIPFKSVPEPEPFLVGPVPSDPETESVRTEDTSDSESESEPTATVSPIKTGNRHAPVTHIRQWARSKGHKVGDGGPIPKWIKDEYYRAHQTGTDG